MSQANDEKAAKGKSGRKEVKSDKLKNPADLLKKFGLNFQDIKLVEKRPLPVGFGFSKADVDAGNIYLSPIRNKDYKVSAVAIHVKMTPNNNLINASGSKGSDKNLVSSFAASVTSLFHLKFEDPYRDCNKLHCTIAGRPTSTGPDDVVQDIFENFGVRTTDDKLEHNVQPMLEFEEYNYHIDEKQNQVSQVSQVSQASEEKANENEDNKKNNKVQCVDVKDALYPIGGWWLKTGDWELEGSLKLVLFFRPLVTKVDQKESKLQVIDTKSEDGDGKYKWYIMVRKLNDLMQELKDKDQSVDSLKKVVTVEGVAKVMLPYLESLFLKTYEQFEDRKDQNTGQYSVEYVVMPMIQSWAYRVPMNDGKPADVFIG